MRQINHYGGYYHDPLVRSIDDAGGTTQHRVRSETERAKTVQYSTVRRRLGQCAAIMLIVALKQCSDSGRGAREFGTFQFKWQCKHSHCDHWLWPAQIGDKWKQRGGNRELEKKAILDSGASLFKFELWLPFCSIMAIAAKQTNQNKLVNFLHSSPCGGDADQRRRQR